MGKLLIVGSSNADVAVMIDHLPTTEESCNAHSHTFNLGGCAHNVAHAAQLQHVDFTLASPVGTGVYGDFVAKELAKEGIPVWKKADGDNGACYCLVDDLGNRSFVAVHGPEYFYDRKWLDELEGYDLVYICGIEIEEVSGLTLVEWLEQTNMKICYAPGPRLMFVPKELHERLVKISGLIHLNAREARQITGKKTTEEAAEELHKYGADVIITDGNHPVYVIEGDNKYLIDVPECKVVDGTGAGDSHIGTILALLEQGKSLKEAIDFANKVSGIVCGHVGATITEEQLIAGLKQFD